MSEWINTGEMMPGKNNRHVLAMYSGHVEKLFMEDGKFMHKPPKDGKPYSVDITWWMPLPEPPK